MSTQKPTFRVMKNGYDRFAVDDAIDQYAQQIEQLQKKLSLYQQQLVETTRTLEDMKQRYQQILTTEQSRQEAADNIARLSLREVVVRSGFTKKALVRDTIERLKVTNQPLLGIVLNRVDVSRNSSYYYKGYGSYYGNYDPDNKKNKKKKAKR